MPHVTYKCRALFVNILQIPLLICKYHVLFTNVAAYLLMMSVIYKRRSYFLHAKYFGTNCTP